MSAPRWFHFSAWLPFVFVVGCTDAPPPGSDFPGGCRERAAPLASDTARLEADARGRLRDTAGRDVVVRGINAGNRSKWAPFVPFPIEEDGSLEEFRAAADEYFEPLPSWGLDSVRLLFSWEALEPEEGEIDELYLDRYVSMVDAAWHLGLSVIVDFHQDVFTSPFCGDGFPPWLVDDLVTGPPRRDCPEWGLKYLNDPAVREAFDRFWADTDGMQGKFRSMWSVMASRLADHPGILAFEVINEPGWGTAVDVQVWKRDVLNPFHETTIDHLHGEAPDILVAYGGPGIDSVSSNPMVHPDREGVLFSAHLYDSALVKGSPWTGTSPGPRLAQLAEEAADEGVPLVLSEFGVHHGSEGGSEWLDLVMDGIDATRMSATLWEYSFNEELWNSEDLSMVSGTGEERAELDAYVRPWLRALAGEDATFTWDTETGEGHLEYESDGGMTELRIPTRRFPEGLEALTIEGDDACHIYEPDEGLLRIKAPSGTKVVVDFSG